MSGPVPVGIMCRKHRVELTWVPTGNPVLDGPMGARTEEEGRKHSRENGGCVVEPWKSDAFKVLS